MDETSDDCLLLAATELRTARQMIMNGDDYCCEQIYKTLAELHDDIVLIREFIHAHHDSKNVL